MTPNTFCCSANLADRCNGSAKTEAAQACGLLRRNRCTGNHDAKVFSHACGRNQMLQLERNFRTLLRQSAFLEGVRELICFADAQQELRLGQEGLDPHSITLGSNLQGAEIDV